MTAVEAFGTLTPPVRILATDIDTSVLEQADRGVYTMERVEKLEVEKDDLKNGSKNASDAQFFLRRGVMMPAIRRTCWQSIKGSASIS